MSHAGLTQSPVARGVAAAAKAHPDELGVAQVQPPRPPTTPERLDALEKNQARLEHVIMSAIRDLAINVNQMHQMQMAAIQNGGHHHHDVAAPAQPTIIFTFLEALSGNTMYRVYQDGPDHPICPNALNVHTRRDGADVFDSVPVEQPLLDLIASEFDRQVGQVSNKVFFVEVHRLSNEPIDDSSVAVAQ